MRKAVTMILLLFLLSACSAAEIPEPSYCPICSGPPYHAPCIVNLSTGKLLELEIYEPHFTMAGEIAKEQRGGYFSLIHYAGVEGYKEGAKLAKVTFPVDSPPMESQYFCSDCRKLLSAFEKDGFVLMDIKDTNNPMVYSISDGTEFTIRCYDVTITLLSQEMEYEVTVLGKLQ